MFGNFMKKNFTIRLEESEIIKLEKFAKTRKITPGEMGREIISSFLNNQEKIDSVVRETHEEVLQLESMISVQTSWMAEVFSTMLGRSYKPFKELTEEEKKVYSNRKAQFIRQIKQLLSNEVATFSEKESIWGTVSISDIEEKRIKG